MTFTIKHRVKQGANLLKLLQDQHFCDVTFVIGDQKEEIGAHRLLLAAVSPVFKRILFGNAEEEKTNKKQNVEIGDINLTAFKCVLNYAYCNDPKLNKDNIAAVQFICKKYEISSLSALCDEYVEKKKIKNIKNVRKQVINACKNDKMAKEQWNNVTKTTNYGCYKKSRIGQFAVHHILDSDGIRDKMGDIIPQECKLKFTFDPRNMSEYTSLIDPFKLEKTFQHASEMTVYMDDRLYNTQLCIEIKGNEHVFWCKSIGKSALDHAMGIEVSDYVMRYRQWIVIHFPNDEFLMVLSGINVGVGFCNLFERKKKVSGHQMIQFEQGDMDKVKVEFFGKNNTYAHIGHIKMILKSKKLKNCDHLVLFDGSVCCVSPPMNAYVPSRGPTAVVREQRYHPYQQNDDNMSVPALGYPNPFNQSTSTFDSTQSNY